MSARTFKALYPLKEEEKKHILEIKTKNPSQIWTLFRLEEQEEQAMLTGKSVPDEELLSVLSAQQMPKTPETDFEYRIENDGITITKYIGQQENVVIPKEINGLPVTTIGKFSFQEIAKTVIIRNGITTIDEAAFFDCPILEHIFISASVTAVGILAFGMCPSLKDIIVAQDNPVYSSHDGVLFSKDGTTLVCCPGGKQGNYIIPDHVTAVGDGAFSSCSSLKSITIHKSITAILQEAFDGCSALTTINIPESIHFIGKWAFNQCSSLKNFLVAADNPSYCALDGVLFNKNITTLICCPATKEGTYNIPDSVTVIEDSAFKNCSLLTNITVSDGVSKIAHYTFAGCSSLQSVILPDSITEIGHAAFQFCKKLVSVTSKKDFAFRNKIQSARDIPMKSMLPQSLTTLESNAFAWCEALESVAIPKGVIAIEYDTFEGCKNLKNIEILDSVIKIGKSAFMGCEELFSVTLHASIKEIGEDAFTWCDKLTVRVEPRSFAQKYAVEHKLKVQTFADHPSCFTYIVKQNKTPCVVITKYTGQDTSVELPQWIDNCHVEEIGEGAFRDNDRIESVVLPDSITAIQQNAFRNCKKLAEIFIPKSVDRIADNAFYGCKNLKIVTEKGSTVCQKVFKNRLFSKIRVEVLL